MTLTGSPANRPCGVLLNLQCPATQTSRHAQLYQAGVSGRVTTPENSLPERAASSLHCCLPVIAQEAQRQKRLRDFAGYQVDAALMSKAAKDTGFMHCLPARRGEEVTDEVMDSPASVVVYQASNRMHLQKGRAGRAPRRGVRGGRQSGDGGLGGILMSRMRKRWPSGGIGNL